MSALFADTFYWIALADSTDSSHQQALAFTFNRAPSGIVTTDEVLVEYLNFFSTVSRGVRREAGVGVERGTD